MAEVGVASSMAASGFAACMGGTPSQILQAAEIGIEHSLGLTCDPIDGLVQVPCIERNSLGAVKAVTGTSHFPYDFSFLADKLRKAAQLALAGDGVHSVSLDEAIEAMRVTARDMHNHCESSVVRCTSHRLKLVYLRQGNLAVWLGDERWSPHSPLFASMLADTRAKQRLWKLGTPLVPESTLRSRRCQP